jgi:hypothetical protein
VASFLKCFDPGCRREPTVRQSRSVYIVPTNQHDSPYQNGVNALVSHLIYQPHSVCSVRKWIYKATVGVRLINQSATVVWNGMQSHCGTLASNTKRYSPGDVASKFLLATRAISTGCCARFLRGETCCTVPAQHYQYTSGMRLVWSGILPYELVCHRYIYRFHFKIPVYHLTGFKSGIRYSVLFFHSLV